MKRNSKWIIGLNENNTVEILEENTGVISSDTTYKA
jgi:hypothetical protein